jgi:hypothetical protein
MEEPESTGCYSANITIGYDTELQLDSDCTGTLTNESLGCDFPIIHGTNYKHELTINIVHYGDAVDYSEECLDDLESECENVVSNTEQEMFVCQRK